MNGAGSFESIHFRHGEIEQDQVGLGFLDVLERLEAGGGFTTDFKTRLIFQQGANATAHDSMIVGDEDAIRLRSWSFFGHHGSLLSTEVCWVETICGN